MSVGRDVGALGERALIRRLTRIIGPPPRGVVGIGDDAAAVPSRAGRSVLTTDALVEGTHFKRGWTTPEEVGAKALAVNLSDVAAMGAVPQYALVALTLPSSTPVVAVEKLYRGLCRVARRENVAVIGGNVARSNRVTVTVTLVGRPHRRELLRDGAAPGDRVFVTGEPGLAALGLKLMQRRAPAGSNLWTGANLAARRRRNAAVGLGWASRARVRFLTPTARTGLVGSLVRLGPSAVIDTSDGLGRDAARLGRVVLARDALDPAGGFAALARELRVDPMTLVLHGGEDYDLLFAVSPRRAERLRLHRHLNGVRIREIGRIDRGAAGLFVETGRTTRRVTDRGFRHFG